VLSADEELQYEPVLERDGVQVSRSPWGPDDEIGRLNWITAESQRAILEGLDGSAVFDLGIEYFFGMPSWSAAHDPKYEIWMTHTPQGSINDNLSGAGAHVHEKYSYCGDLDPHVRPHRHPHRHAQPPRLLRHVLERVDGRERSRQPRLEQGRRREVPAADRPRRAARRSPGCTASIASPTAT